MNDITTFRPARRGFLKTGAVAGGGLVIGFFLSTVLLYHGTFFVNSLAHVLGTRRYATTRSHAATHRYWTRAPLALPNGFCIAWPGGQREISTLCIISSGRAKPTMARDCCRF